MNKIEKMMQKDFWEADIPDFQPVAWESGYKAGANAVLKEIKRYIQQATQEHEVGLVWISGLINLINELEGKE